MRNIVVIPGDGIGPEVTEATLAVLRATKAKLRFLFAVAGSIVPAAILLAIISPLSNYLRKKSPYLDNFFEKLFDKTRKEHSKRFKRYGAILIIAIIAIPLPGSGSGAGALIAFIFGVDYWKGLSLIVAGTTLGGLMLTAGFGSIFKILDLFA